ncbi:MAG: VanZ family protein [Coprobacillaceae bacterium]
MKKIAWLCYGVFFIAFGVQLWYAMSEVLTFTTIGKISIVSIQIIMLILGTLANIQTLSGQQRKNDIRFAQIIIFLIFLGNLGYLLFFDSDFGRTNHQDFYTFSEYFQLNVNLLPFNTINLYLDGYRSGVITWSAMIINLIGNIVAFMPFSYFMPLLFKSQRKFIVFFITMLGIIISVEVTQVLMQSGSGDVDDLILNMIGVILIYLLFKIPVLNRLIYGVDNRE